MLQISKIVPFLAILAATALVGNAPVRAQDAKTPAAPTPEAMARIRKAPTLRFQNELSQRVLGRAYNDALDNLLRINTVPDNENKHDKAGLMSDSKLFIKAGGAYNDPWTRDASINSWNAGSLLEPVVARNTLWAVCQKQDDGSVVLQRDNQWWDKVIWITAAWNHYKVTGDREFLQTAYGVTQDELQLTRKEYFNADYGLFRGPAFFADGIAAYPEPIYETGNGSGFVLDHKNSQNIMALSTNCVYYAAYRNAANMAGQLNRPGREIKAYNDAADALKTAINGKLWNAEKGSYDYFVYGSSDKAGQRDGTQEGIGLSFAILSGVADAAQSASIVKNAHVSPIGITTQWPHFARFSDEKPGRHNVMVWPLVNGMWASAATQVGDVAAFKSETENLALLGISSGDNFNEIYNPLTGKGDGGWQGFHWGPLLDQTWSATAYLRMIYGGMFGMNFRPDGVTLSPTLPDGWGDVKLSGLKYRGATLDIALQGQGNRIASVTVDGKPAKNAFIPATLTGAHSVNIALRP